MSALNSFSMYKNAIILGSLLATAGAQQIGTYTAETHPSLSWSTCKSGGSCTTNAGSITLDANWRWVHGVNTSTNCYTGNTWNSAICDTDASCAQDCALDGADYSGTYGITTSGNSLRLDFVTGSNVGSRTYLMADNTHYEIFDLLNQEFTFTVDVSKLPCGLNGALYFVTMDADGGVSKYPNNKAGAQYGVGYCDSQCPRDLKFIGGQANVEGWTPSANNSNTGIGTHGSCCAELDIWEANSISEALTPHPCDSATPTICTADDCGGTYSDNRYAGTCDPDGCDFNPYRLGNTNFYGAGMTVDTTKPFTVVTQFVTDDGTSSGSLSEIRRYYVQNGVVIPQPSSKISGISGNVIDSTYCAAEASTFNATTSFTKHGGLAGMGAGLKNGMVLVMSLWDDYSVGMRWLDSTYPTDAAGTPGAARGTCATTSGDPKTVESQDGSAYVVFSDIRVGPFNSTFSGTPGSPGTGTTTTSVGSTSIGSTSTTTSSTSTGTGVASHYGQCGGTGWNGPTSCASGFTCTVVNPYYSQCL